MKYRAIVAAKRAFTAALFATSCLVAAGATASAETLGGVTDAIGVVKVAKGQPVFLGGMMVLAGPDLALGLDASRGAQIAFDDHKNMVAGHPIKYLPEDAGCSVEGGQAAATRLASNKNIIAVIGPACSSEARGGAPILWNVGMPNAITSATAPALTAPDRPVGLQGLARFVYNDADAAAAAVTYAKSLKVTKVATLHDGSLYAQSLAEKFGDLWKAAGGTIVAAEAISPSDTDLRPVLTRIGSSGPQLLFAPIFTSASAYLARQKPEIATLAKTDVLGTDSVLSPAFLEAAGDSAKGYRLTGIDNDPKLLGAGYPTLVAKYKEKFGEAPIAGYHANGYDAATAVMLAIEKVAKTDAAGDTYIGRKAVRDALMTTTGLAGVTGPVSCDKFGDCAPSHFAVFEYINGDKETFELGKNPKKVYP